MSPSRLRYLAVVGAVLLGVAAAPASAEGAVTRVVPGNGPSFDPAVSSDGRYVAFVSDATNLVGGDTNNASDVFVRDRTTSTTRRISVTGGGGQANGASSEPAISGDGRYVVFTSAATNLTPRDTNHVADIFIRDTVQQTTRRVSVSNTEAQANGVSESPDISSDGSTVVYASRASNLITQDTNQVEDVFRYSVANGKTVRVSVTNTGGQGDRNSSQPSVSANGSRITFRSDAMLTAPPEPGLGNWYGVFVRDTTARTTRVLLWGRSDFDCDPVFYTPTISGNGLSVVTRVISGCDTDHNSLKQVRLDGQPGHSLDAQDFYYGALYSPAQDATGRLVAYAEDSDGGTPDTTRQVVALHDWNTGTEQVLPHLVGNLDLSNDGRTLVFSTSDALLPTDANATNDVYVWTPSTGAIRLISIGT